mmetsp:Transcript_1374/g.3029  ORF Transcript_1374/g.3029 Transcript_1374/m.3029 type:complete len:192 (-) Transcript_1374:1563-2138(-)
MDISPATKYDSSSFPTLSSVQWVVDDIRTYYATPRTFTRASRLAGRVAARPRLARICCHSSSHHPHTIPHTIEEKNQSLERTQARRFAFRPPSTRKECTQYYSHATKMHTLAFVSEVKLQKHRIDHSCLFLSGKGSHRFLPRTHDQQKKQASATNMTPKHVGRCRTRSFVAFTEKTRPPGLLVPRIPTRQR